MKILVVDDSRTMRKIVRNSLEDMGYSAESVVEASDGVKALEALQTIGAEVNLVLADWNMPNMDGLALVKKMQAEPNFASIPIIMITGEAQRDKVVEAINAGARNYIVKPFSSETLRQKVLTIEMEMLGRKSPSDTAVIRFSKANTSDKAGGELPFIAQLPEELVAGIYEAGDESQHAAGETLIEPDDEITSLYIIDRGEVDLEHFAGNPPERRSKGECVGEIAFLSGDPADIKAVCKQDTVLLSVGKDAFEELLAEYPHLSFYLTRLLAKRASKSQTDSPRALSGRLNMMTIAELVQSLNQSRKTGTLRIANGNEKGTIVFEDGNIRNAKSNDHEGEEAFYQLVTWADGSFEFEADAMDMPHVIFRATMSLLMEGMRRQDELHRMRT